jgi:hypothetical protein
MKDSEQPALADWQLAEDREVDHTGGNLFQ